MNSSLTYIGLGSNLSNPVLQIQTAVKTLQNTANVQLIHCSDLWASKPMGPSDQPDYVNAVVAVTTQLAPLELLDLCQSIEQAHRRIKTRHWGPRTLDLDILLMGDLQLHLPRLQVPHPGMTQRGFVLAPLHQIAPDLYLANQPLTYWLSQCDLSGLHRLDHERLDSTGV